MHELLVIADPDVFRHLQAGDHVVLHALLNLVLQPDPGVDNLHICPLLRVLLGDEVSLLLGQRDTGGLDLLVMLSGGFMKDSWWMSSFHIHMCTSGSGECEIFPRLGGPGRRGYSRVPPRPVAGKPASPDPERSPCTEEWCRCTRLESPCFASRLCEVVSNPLESP